MACRLIKIPEGCAVIEPHKLKKRDRYLNKLIGFQDQEPVKVITGIRRCGKSSLLKLMAAHLCGFGLRYLCDRLQCLPALI